jgi:hypothetical protein
MDLKVLRRTFLLGWHKLNAKHKLCISSILFCLLTTVLENGEMFQRGNWRPEKKETIVARGEAFVFGLEILFPAQNHGEKHQHF